MTVQRLVYAGLLTAALFTSLPLLQARLWLPGGAALGVVVLWGVAQYRGWRYVEDIALAVVALLALIALVQDDTFPGLPLAALCGALVAWNGMAVTALWNSVDEVVAQETLQRLIVGRLLLVAGLGLALGLVANFMRLNFGFGLAVVLAFVSIMGLTRAIIFLREAVD